MNVLQRVFMPATAAFVAIALVTACGGTEEETTRSPSESSEGEEFNDSDVTFAHMMIPHHEQAVTMTELAPERAGDEVQALAEEIQAAQGPEIDRMNTLLESWGQESVQDMEDMGHDVTTGVLYDELMAELEEYGGDEFVIMVRQMIIEHHEGAGDMAETEHGDGTIAQARDLALHIIDDPNTEIEQMNEMLGVE